MAGLKRCLGIDLGNSRIKVAEMALEKSGPRLVQLVQADVDVPPGTDDEERSLRVARMLRKILKDNKITAKDAVFSVPGQAVFQRIVKLPRTTPDRLRRIIQYEARQQIPFPLAQTYYEYQVFEDTQAEDEVEVLLVAIQRDKISQFVRLYRRMGLRIAGIAVSYLALYNFHRLRTGRLPKSRKAIDQAAAADQAAKGGHLAAKKKSGFSFSMFQKSKPAAAAESEGAGEGESPAGEAEEDLFGGGELFEEVKAYVNIGASAMDLAIEKKGAGGLGFCRPIPHAGNGITRAIQDALSLDSFREAEQIKRSETMALSTVAELDAGQAKINRQASEAATRLIERRIVGELRRSLDFYISQPDGVAVDGLVLSGGQACLPHLAEYIEEKMGLPVELLENFDAPNVAVDSLADGADWASGAVAVGLAAQGLGLGAVQIDFLPEDLKTYIRFKGRYREVAAMVAILLGMIGLSVGTGQPRVDEYKRQTEEMATKKDSTAKVVVKKFDDLKAERKALGEQFERFKKLAGPRDMPLQFWAEVIVEKPPEVVLDLVQVMSDGKVRLVGECVTIGPITAFAKNLEKRADLVSDLNVSTTPPKTDPYKRFRGGTVIFFDMSMKCVGKHTRVKKLTPTPKT